MIKEGENYRIIDKNEWIDINIERYLKKGYKIVGSKYNMILLSNEKGEYAIFNSPKKPVYIKLEDNEPYELFRVEYF